MAATLAALTACGTSSSLTTAPPVSSPTSTSITGTVGGQSFAASETAGLYNATSTTFSPYAGAIISNIPQSCALFQGGMTAPPSTQILAIEVFHLASKAVPGPGTYTYNSLNDIELVVQYLASDSTCAITTNESPMSGSVMLDTVSAGSVAGSFDLTFANADHLSGTFVGPVCNFDLSMFGQNGTGCMQRDP